jgi:hypothetical protein
MPPQFESKTTKELSERTISVIAAITRNISITYNPFFIAQPLRWKKPLPLQYRTLKRRRDADKTPKSCTLSKQIYGTNMTALISISQGNAALQR